MKKNKWWLILIFIIVDQVTKGIATSSLILGNSIRVINNFFSITLVYNKGAAWGILSGGKFFLISLGVLAVIFIVKYICELKNKFHIFGCIFLISGIIGNLLDRIFYGYVIDFLDFNFFGYNYPVFNFADIFIVLGVLIIIFYEVRGSVKNGRKN